MDLKSIRRANLKCLVSRKTNQGDAAKLLETTSPYLSILLNGKGNIGSNLARRAEETFGMPEGWMDIDHSGPTITRVQLLTDDDLMVASSTHPDRELTEVTFEPVSASGFAYSVMSDSMNGMIYDGDIAIVDPEVAPTNGSVVLVKTANGIFVRQFLKGPVGNPILKAANPQFPTFELTLELEIVGVVVEAQSRRKLRIAA